MGKSLALTQFREPFSYYTQRLSWGLGDTRFGFAIASLEKCRDASSSSKNRNTSGEKAGRCDSGDHVNILKPSHESNVDVCGELECEIENKAKTKAENADCG